MAVIITAAMLRQAAAANARKPAEDRWSNLILRSGRYARRVKRQGIEASEVRDERPRRAVTFGSELPVCRKHGAKGSTKPLPGRTRYGIGAINQNIRLRNSMIKAGLLKPVVVKRQPMHTVAEAAVAAMPVLDEGEPLVIRSFNELKQRLTAGRAE